MRKPPQVSEQHLSDTQYVMDSIPPGECYSLNLADERQYRYQKTLYHLNGYTPERYPQLFEQLEADRENDLATKSPGPPEPDSDMLQPRQSDFASLNVVTAVGASDDNTKATASGYSTIIGGTIHTALILWIYECVGGKNVDLLGFDSVITFENGKFVPVLAVGTKLPTAEMCALLNYSHTLPNGQKKRGVTKLYNHGDVARDPSVTTPAQKADHTSNPNIEIGLGRGPLTRQHSDVDYWFNENFKLPPSTVIVPFAGSVEFTSDIDTPLTGGRNLAVEMTVALKDGGASTSPADMAAVYSAFSIGADGKTLNWSLVPGRDGSLGNPVQFGDAPELSNNHVTYFNATIAVKTANSGAGFSYAYVRSSDNPDGNPLDGIAYIKPIEFVMHCLARNTLVTLADGRAVAIEEVDNTYEVRTDNAGGTMPVRATSHAPARPGEVLLLKTDQGHQVVLSDGHVVMTPKGPLQAGELTVGDAVVVLDGEATITSIDLQKTCERPAKDLRRRPDQSPLGRT